MAGKIVIASPALEKAVKEKLKVNTPPRRFGRSSLKDNVYVPDDEIKYYGYFQLSLVETEEGFKVQIDNGLHEFIASEAASKVRLNNQTYSIYKFTSSEVYTAQSEDTVLAWFYIEGDIEGKVGIIERSAEVSDEKRILLGRLASVNGSLMVIQDSYGTPFLPLFFSCCP